MASLMLVSLMLGLAQWSFDRGLLQHINQRAASQYQSMIEPLTNLYRQYGHWDFFQTRQHLWEYVQSEAGIDTPPARLHPADRNRGQQPRHDRPEKYSGKQNPGMRNPEGHNLRGQNHEERRGHRPPPWSQQANAEGNGHPDRPRQGPHGAFQPDNHRPQGQLREGQRPEGPRGQQDGRLGPLGPRGLAQRGEPLALVDAEKTFVIGRLPREDHRQYLAIEMDENIIGYVVYANRERLMDDYDLDFSQELSENLWWIAALMILLSASLALPFSHLLLKPLRPIVNTIHRLATGDLTARVGVKSKDEIGQVGNDVNHLAQTLSENDESRKQWLANISHELRTPLAVMRGELEAMLDGIREISREHIESAHQEALHLQRLVEDLYQLTSSDIGALSYHKSDFDFCEFMEDTIERFTPLINQAGLRLELFKDLDDFPEDCPDAWINGDPQRIAQLIHNLIQNSIKYTESPGTVRISMKTDSDHIYLNIEDSAPGVDNSDLEKIFDHLYRTEASRNRKTGGSGLGLAICKKIIEGHQGRLTAFPSKLGGVDMQVVLPRLK